MQSQLWNTALASIEGELPRAQFQNWFKPLQLIKCDDNRVVLGVPNRFHEQWLKKNYSSQLNSIRKQYGEGLQLEFELVTLENKNASHSSIESSENNSSTQKNNEAPIPQTEAHWDNSNGPTLHIHSKSNLPTQKINVVEPPNLPQIQSKFISFDYNKLAYECANMFISGENASINPLILIAGTGMGKTHLATEIGKRLFAADPNLRIRYTHGEAFTSEVVQSIQTNTNHIFKKKYREETDVLIFDDVNLLEKRTRSQEELLYIFNELTSRGGRVVFTLSQSPHLLERFSAPLKSRLLSGVSAEIKAPPYDERIEILSRKCADEKISIEPSVIKTMASHGQKNIRELIGSLIRLHIQAKLENKTIDHEFLGQKAYLAEAQKETVTMDEIISLVETNFGISREDMTSKSRKSVIVWARQVAMFLARHYTLLSLEQIGKQFGRDHATVVHAFQKVKDTVATKPNKRYEVEFLKQRISSQACREEEPI